MLKGFIFDLDGVVTDSAKYHLAAWGELAKQLGITLPATANEALRGRSRMDSLAIILGYGDQQKQYTEVEKENDGFTIQVQQTSQIEKTHRLSPCKMESPQDQLQGELDYESVHPSYLNRP